MELTQAIDGYCERTDPAYWSEPVNALTNLAFLLAAAIMWQRSAAVPTARLLSLLLGAIGVGSYLFHTHATVWAALADTLSIAVFVLTYLYLANREFCRLDVRPALGLTALFIPYEVVTVSVFRQLPGFAVSAGYWPLPLLIGGYAVALWRRAPETARGLAIGNAMLVLSLFFRSIDESVCPSVPLGTHFLWHVLNGLLLGWLIEVYRRHVTGDAGAASRS